MWRPFVPKALPLPALPVGIYSLCSKLPSLVSSGFQSFSNAPASWSSKRMILLPATDSIPST